ncbi:MAG: methyltransferase [Bacteroidales bacterium]|nr:methyltransferase [Bacteroidales bacterium]MBR5782468.1 methyltransferase [Bacteroidales bacterium]
MFHHRSTMRVGTDAVLFAQWVELSSSDSVLDVGTGTGVIPLILAQKGVGSVDAVELDSDSYEEASLNFRISVYSDKLSVVHNDVRVYADNAEKKYDLIVSNPPYYASDVKPIKEKKVMARHVSTLSFKDLLVAAKKMMKEDARFALVLPFYESRLFIKEAENVGFYLQKEFLISPIEGKDPNRVNMQFVLKEVESVERQLFTIRNKDYSYTKEYKEFLKDYYLDF